MPILFTLLTFLTFTMLLLQGVGIRYAYDGKMSIEISYLVFTLSLKNFNEGKRRRGISRHATRILHAKNSAKYLIRRSRIVLGKAYKNDSGAPYALMAIRNYGLSSVFLTFLISYLKNNAASFTVADGAVRLIGKESLPKRASLELHQSFSMLNLLIALLIFLREKLKKRRLSYGRK